MNAEQDKQVEQFARSAGIDIQQYKLLQNQPIRRSTRPKKQPQLSSGNSHSHLKQTPDKNIEKSQNADTVPAKEQIPSTPKKESRRQTCQTIKSPKFIEKYPLKQNLTLPNSVDQFFQSYTSYSAELPFINEQQRRLIEQKKSQLFELLKTTIETGGIASVISQGYKEEVFAPFKQKFNVQTTQQIFNIYKRLLFHFQYHLLQNYKFKDFKDASTFFQEATFITQEELSDFIQKDPLDTKYFQYDIMVFRNGQNVIGINSQQIGLDNVAYSYKDHSVDIRIQRALDYGFKPKTMTNQPYQMLLKNYRIYQKLCHEYATKNCPIDQQFIERLGDVKNLDVNGTLFKDKVWANQVFFAVNFDPDDGFLVKHIAEQVKGTFIGYKEKFDLLSYLDHQIPGCSFPQFYFKVKGVWTGGHQENVNMCAVNINHGPDSSEWYSMEIKYVQQFRAQLKKQHKMDLYGKQGLWYEKINWFVEQGKYPIKKIVQKKGDIVISGPGTLHWVRSHGIALQSAWNLFPITLNALEYAYSRQQENERIKFSKSNVIPLKSLTLKFLNHQSDQITPQIRQLCLQKLKMWYKKEQTLYESLQMNEGYQFRQGKPRKQKLNDLQGFCEVCLQEILIYFVNGKNLKDVVCLSCFQKDERSKKKNKRFYMRHDLYDLKQLIRLTEQAKPFSQIKSFCNGPFVGQIPKPCTHNKSQIQKQSVLIHKINQMNQQLNKIDSVTLKKKEQGIQRKKEAPREEDLIDVQKDQDHFKEDKIIGQSIDPQKEQPIVEENKYFQTFHRKDQVFYIGEPKASGFWQFKIPQDLKIVTEYNYMKLLKILYNQQFFMRKKCQQNRLQRPDFQFFVKQPYSYNSYSNQQRPRPNNSANKYWQYGRPYQPQNGRKGNFDDENFPKAQSSVEFSEDSQHQNEHIKGKKKVHLNENIGRSAQEQQNSNKAFTQPKQISNRQHQNPRRQIQEKQKKSRKHKTQHKSKRQKSSSDSSNNGKESSASQKKSENNEKKKEKNKFRSHSKGSSRSQNRKSNKKSSAKHEHEKEGRESRQRESRNQQGKNSSSKDRNLYKKNLKMANDYGNDRNETNERNERTANDKDKNYDQADNQNRRNSYDPRYDDNKRHNHNNGGDYNYGLNGNDNYQRNNDSNARDYNGGRYSGRSNDQRNSDMRGNNQSNKGYNNGGSRGYTKNSNNVDTYTNFNNDRANDSRNNRKNHNKGPRNQGQTNPATNTEHQPTQQSEIQY